MIFMIFIFYDFYLIIIHIKIIYTLTKYVYKHTGCPKVHKKLTNCYIGEWLTPENLSKSGTFQGKKNNNSKKFILISKIHQKNLTDCCIRVYFAP